MEISETKSMQSVEARSIASHGSGGANPFSNQQFFTNTKDNVKVVIRVRPLNDREKSNGGSKKCVSVENQTTVIVDAKPDYKVFNFDFVGNEDLEQDTVFNQIARPIADCCLEGYNGSIFAYGQTGAGKTFTIQGPSITQNGEESVQCSLRKEAGSEYDNRGLMARSFEYIFDCLTNAKQNAESSNGESNFEYLVRCTYLEIYNEQIMDLLEPTSVNLHIREDIKKGVYVEGLLEEVVLNEMDMMDLIVRGGKNRHIGSTSMNKESSRSHSVLTTIIETKSMKDGGGVWNIKTSRFHIIDLAGSERQKYTNAIGDRLKEAGMINKSLSALGNVINSLVDISEGKNRHVHYRDSKLTFLLRDSLGGNSKTVIIANISPSSTCYGETISTLKFAQRAKLIRNKAIINEDSSGTIQLLKNEISRLKKELAETEQKQSATGSGQCAFCRNNINGEQPHEDESEDEMLLDSSNLENSMLLKSIIIDKDDPVNVAGGQHGVLNEAIIKKFKNQKCELQNMRKRVVYLEGLLSANLDNLTSQQKFHDQEQQKNQQQIKKLQQAVDSYEKQCARDKMIIKFREDRITKLEQNQPVTVDDKQKQINDLKKEIAMWKDAVDHNAQAAKLFAEKADLTNKLEQMQKEVKQTPDSMSAQMRSLNELNEGLNEYLKQYCEESKKEVESELSRVKQDFTERIEELNQKLEHQLKQEQDLIDKHLNNDKEWKSQSESMKQEIERLNTEYLKEKEEIERLNKDAFNKIKQEIEAICENKTDVEKESQLLRVKLMEKERELERETINKDERHKYYQNKEAELQSQLTHLETNIAQLEELSQKDRENAKVEVDELHQQIEQERKQQSARLKHEVEQWEKRMKDMERQMLAEQSEKEMVQEQCESMTMRVKSLEDQNETVQSSLMYKEEEANELTRQIKTKEQQILDLTEKATQLQESSTQQLDEKNLALEQLQCRINELIEERDKLVGELDQSKKDQEMLRQALEEIKVEIDLINKEKKELEQLIESKESEMVKLTHEISEKQTQNNELNAQCSELQESIQALERQVQIDKKIYEDQQDKVIQKYETSLQQLNKEMTQFAISKNSEIGKLQETMLQEHADQQELMDRYETTIADLRLQIENNQNNYTEKVSATTQQYEDAINELNEEIKNKETQHKDKIKFIQDHNIKELEQIQEAHSQEIKQTTLEKEQSLQLIQQEVESKISSIVSGHHKQIQELDQAKSEQTKTLEHKIEILQQDAQQKVEALVSNQQEIQTQLAQKLEQQQQHYTQEQHSAKLLQQKIEQSFLEKLQDLRQEKDLEKQVIQQEKQKEIEELVSNSSSETSNLLKQITEQSEKAKEEKECLDQTIAQMKDNFNEKEKEYQKTISEIEERLVDKQNEFDLHQQEWDSIMEKESQQYENRIQQLQDELDSQVTTLTSSRSQSEESYNLRITTQQTMLLQKEKEFNQQKSELNETIFKLESDLQGHLKTIQELETKYQQQVFENQTQNEEYQSQIQSYQQQLDSLNSLQQEEKQHNKQLSQQLVETLAQVDEFRQQSSQQQNELENVIQVQQEERQQNRDISQELLEVQQQLKIVQEKYTQISIERNQLVVEYQQIQEQTDDKTDQIEQLQLKCGYLQKELDQQKRLMDETLPQLNNEHLRKYQELQQEYSSQQLVIQQEVETYKNHCKELNQQISKWKSRSEDQNEMLNKSKDTITGMVQKENELMKELEKKINELRDHQEKWKKRVQEARDEKEQMKKEWERMKKENENLRELVKLKDRQIEDQLNQDEKERDIVEKLQKDNKDLRNQVTKREFEMKEVVRTLKFYSEEKARLEKELEKLHRENDQLIGHKNPSQKIQHHLKIKEENNKLREDNFKLQEELRRKTEALVKTGASKELTQIGSLSSLQQEDTAAASNTLKEDMKKMKKENMTYQETINRLVDHILSQPGLMKVLGISDEVNEKIQQQTGSSKVKNAMEIISLFSNVVQSKERDLKELSREKKKIECKLDIVEKEKNLCKQQLELMQHSSSAGSSFIQTSNNPSFIHSSKSPTNIHHHQQQQQQQQQQQYSQHQQQQQDTDFKMMQQQPHHRMEGIQSQDKSNHNIDYMGGIPKNTPSPIYNFKQVQKEKENMNSKKDLFGDKRSGSARRTAYLNSNNTSLKQ